MLGTGFTNSFTSGEISEDAWDRTDLQPIAKGCEEAINYVIRIAGPLGKRRGFWRLGAVLDEAKPSRLIPFRRSIDDALMLEFGDLEVRVWNNNGSPLLHDDLTQVTFASPYTQAQLDGLRWKQISDVIYIRHRDGLRPRALYRTNNVTWTFVDEFFPNGPWLGENTNAAQTITVTGADETDANPDTGAGTIFRDTVVALVASDDLFHAGMEGTKFRLRAGDGMPGVKGWAVGEIQTVGVYCVSVGRVYRAMSAASDLHFVTNPPVNITGQQSDGGNLWEYRHDGAGVVRIDAVTDARHATGTVRLNLPFKSGTATPYWAEMAWSNYRGWPRMWPSVREERLVEGGTASNLDFIDLTETAGFDFQSQTYTPGLGSGQVVATDAVRRRAGEDGGEVIWSQVSSYLLIGSASAEILVAGSVLDEGISPSSVVVKTLSGFGSADVFPAKAHTGLIYVTRGGETLREIAVDPGQNVSGQDMTVLASHIGARGLAQLAWVPQPDETLWIRLADGGLAAMVYHKEQQVRGFTRVGLPGGFLCEDIAVLPGPGRQETLWMIVRRDKGAGQRQLWMLSQRNDKLFMDCAEYYSGAPVSTITGLGHLDGEVVRVLADGVQIPDPTVSGGQITLPSPARVVLVGLPMKCRFKSLKLDQTLGGALNERQRVVGVLASVKTAEAFVGIEGSPLRERVSDRKIGDIPAAATRRIVQDVTIATDTGRDPRIVIEDETAYDGTIYSLKPRVER